jgi:ribosomal protein S24E
LSTIELLSDSENKLLSRREVECVFRGGNGFLTRDGAAEAIAAKVGVPKEDVQVVSLKGRFGVRDLKASALIFADPSARKRQLPDYFRIRQLPKEERKKAKEQKKGKAAPTAESQTPAPPVEKS